MNNTLQPNIILFPVSSEKTRLQRINQLIVELALELQQRRQSRAEAQSRPRVEDGMTQVRGRPRSVDMTEARRLKDQGLSIEQIARRLGCSKSGAHKAINRK
jgi:AraC-like DNA-binding protein